MDDRAGTTLISRGRGAGTRRRLALVSLVTVGVLSAAGTANASVTIGQNPLSTPATSCITQFDAVQPTVTSATRYVVPNTVAQGTLTRWTHRAAAGSGQQMTLKVFRDAGGSNYQVVGRDGPRGLNPGSLNTFNTSIPVKAGDIIGANSANAASVPNACLFSANGDSHLERPGDLPDGGTGAFASVADTRVNASARIEPTNAFSFGSVFSSRKKGFAIVAVTLPNPGSLRVSGSGVGSTASKTLKIGGPGTVNIWVWATGHKKRKLKRKGRVWVVPSFRYTPTSGDRHTQAIGIKLKRKHKKHRKRR